VIDTFTKKPASPALKEKPPPLFGNDSDEEEDLDWLS